ncbi:MAG TPA: PQQ-binding-like beta-propeller repeat protein, partial [Actinomycetota bacterium]|nr:PQQ-binding-like beta-propeller repeat protein [Actinomycetota bacterium]
MLSVVVGAGAWLFAVPAAVLADWPQFQGDAAHAGVSDGPQAPLAVAWRNDDVELRAVGALGGLSAPVVAEDGTIVVVGPTEVLGFSSEDGSSTFSVERDFGPSVQPAIATGADGAIVVYPEGYGDDPPVTATPTTSPSPSPPAGEGDEGVFDSHVNAIDLEGDPAWDEPAQLEAVVIGGIAVDDEAAYVADVDGGVTALELTSGEQRWTVDVGTTVAGAVTVDGGRLYVSTIGSRTEPSAVVSLDARTGEELWRTGEDDEVAGLVSTPVLAGDALVVLEATGVLSLDPSDGAVRWRTDVVNPVRNPPFPFQGTATPTVAADGDVVVAVDASGRVFALEAASGTVRWDHALNDPSLLSLPLLAGEQVLVPTDQGTLSAIDAGSGRLVGRLDAGAPLLRGLADAGDLLVGVTGFDDAGLVAFEAGVGALLDEPSPTTPDP